MNQQSTGRAQYRGTVSQALKRIRHSREYHDAPLHTRGGSRMPELGSYGSVRGARGNSRPYRESHRRAVKVMRLTRSGVSPSSKLLSEAMAGKTTVDNG